MFFKKKPMDCISLLDGNKSDIGKPFNNRFLASATYSYPSHKDKDVMDRIFYQKKLVDENGVFEAIHSLARNTAYGEEYIKFSEKLIQNVPRWSDWRNYSQTSATFLLNGVTYTAEQHSSNFNSLVCLYRNSDLVFGATLIGRRQHECDSISISNSKLDEKETSLLIAFANLSEDTAKRKKNESWSKFTEEQASEFEDRVKQNF
jgi:hypothetical protein